MGFCSHSRECASPQGRAVPSEVLGTPRVPRGEGLDMGPSALGGCRQEGRSPPALGVPLTPRSPSHPRCFVPAVPPRQPVMSSLLETRGGQLGIIQCSVESDPEANLTLWRGGEALACTGGCPPAPSPRLQATASYNSLRLELRDVVLEDEGTYVCQARNTQGNASASVAFSAESECGAGEGVPGSEPPGCDPGERGEVERGAGEGWGLRA